MRRAAEDGAGAVLHENEIGDQHGKLGALDHRVPHAHAGVEALLLLRLELGGAGAVMMALVDERGGAGILLGDGFRQRMIRRDGDEACAVQRVRPRGEHLDQVVAVRRGADRLEPDEQPLGSADPVRLHQPDLLGPALESVQRLKQVLRIVGDLEHPFRLLALLDQRAGAPAAAVDHLLVGKHRPVDRVPIDLPRLAVDQAGFQHVEEQALLLVIVVEVAGRELARPIERQAHAFELAAHDGDIVVGPFGGMDAALDGRILGREAESIPAHRVQHVVALGAHGAGHDVAHGVVPHMAHMDAARGVWEHFKNIIFRTRIVLGRAEDAALLPRGLPMLLSFRRVVAIGRHVFARSCLAARRNEPEWQERSSYASAKPC